MARAMIYTMTALLLVLLLQSQTAQTPTVKLPVSLDRVRDGLAKGGVFDTPAPRPQLRRRPVFRTRVNARMILEGTAWDDRSTTPLWVRSTASPLHIDFLQAVTPEEVRSSTVHPCCDVMPVAKTVTGFIGNRIQSWKQGRAQREVEKTLRAAGIRK